LTIDLVRFRTVPDQLTPAVIRPVVIWVGVLPDSLAGEDAFNSANPILALLEDDGHYMACIHVRALCSPELHG